MQDTAYMEVKCVWEEERRHASLRIASVTQDLEYTGKKWRECMGREKERAF